MFIALRKMLEITSYNQPRKKRVEITVGVAKHMTPEDCKQLSKMTVHRISTHEAVENKRKEY